MDKALFHSIKNFNDFYDTLGSIKEFSSSWIGPGSDKVFSNNNLSNYKKNYFDSENYYVTQNVGYTNVIDLDPDFDYHINLHGFRSQHFKPVDNKKITILTGGCSHSFGEGLPNNLRWQSFLKNYFNENNIEMFDVSSMGASSRLIIRNIFAFIRNYGKPNYIFLVLPDLARDFIYLEQIKQFINGHADSNHLINKNTVRQLKEFSKNFDAYNSAMQVIEYMWQLEEFCKYADIKLFWSTWCTESAKFFNASNLFKNYLMLNFNIFSEMNSNYIDNDKIDKLLINNKIQEKSLISNIKKYWYFANDGNHYGVFFTHEIAKMFGEKITNDNQN